MFEFKGKETGDIKPPANEQFKNITPEGHISTTEANSLWKSEFKEFARKHPELIEHVKNNSMTWQKFYEIYDIYGEDENAWNPYFQSKHEERVSSFTDKLKNIDTEMIQEHLANAQKALGVLSELTGSSKSGVSPSVVPKVPRPLNHFFED